MSKKVSAELKCPRCGTQKPLLVTGPTTLRSQVTLGLDQGLGGVSLKLSNSIGLHYGEFLST